MLLWIAGLLWPRIDLQGQGREDDPASFIGLTLTELMERAGIPQAVYPVRGREEWQDDVVFVYSDGNFYIIKDRVWQLELKSVYRINVGDPRAAVLLALGEQAEDRGNCIIYPLPVQQWPLALRCNLDAAGKVSALFIYRSDL